MQVQEGRGGGRRERERESEKERYFRWPQYSRTSIFGLKREWFTSQTFKPPLQHFFTTKDVQDVLKKSQRGQVQTDVRRKQEVMNKLIKGRHKWKVFKVPDVEDYDLIELDDNTSINDVQGFQRLGRHKG